jgi:hypothetical protein
LGSRGGTSSTVWGNSRIARRKVDTTPRNKLRLKNRRLGLGTTNPTRTNKQLRWLNGNSPASNCHVAFLSHSSAKRPSCRSPGWRLSAIEVGEHDNHRHECQRQRDDQHEKNTATDDAAARSHSRHDDRLRRLSWLTVGRQISLLTAYRDVQNVAAIDYCSRITQRC